MSTVSLHVPRKKEQPINVRANALAERLESGVDALATFAATITDAEWQKPVSATDSRSVGTIVHHVGNMFPIEIQFARMILTGNPITGVTYDDIDKINGDHGKNFARPTKAQALEFLRANSAQAAAAIRALSDEELDLAVPNSMYSGAILTCQFWLEDHPVRHAYHHLGKIRKALNR